MSLDTFLDGRKYTTLRGLQADALSDTGHRLTSSFSDDGAGGGTSVFTNSSTVQCRVFPLTGQESEAGGKIDDRSTHQILIPSGGTLQPEDRFLVDNRGTYTITALRDRTSEWVTEFEAVKL